MWQIWQITCLYTSCNYFSFVRLFFFFYFAYRCWEDSMRVCMYSSEKRPFQFNDLKFESWSSMNLSQFSKVVGRIIFKLIWTKLISQIWVFWLACNEISFVISQSKFSNLGNQFWETSWRKVINLEMILPYLNVLPITIYFYKFLLFYHPNLEWEDSK